MRQHKGVKVRLPHGARHLVEQHGQAGPAVQKSQEALCIRMLGLVQRVKGERREFQLCGVGGQAKTQCRVHGVADVQVMRPALGPVFPRMHAGIGADVVQRPVRARALRIVGLQAGRVVLGFIAEQGAKALQPVGAGDQPVPVVVADLMAEMPEQRAVGLMHGLAHRFACGVVGLVEVQRDQAGVVPGHDVRAVVRRAQEVEHQPAFRVFADTRGQRQAECEQGRDQPALGELHLAPEFAVVRVFRIVKVGNGAVEPAGAAQQHLRLALSDRHQPVAGRRALQVGAAQIGRGRRIAGWGVSTAFRLPFDPGVRVLTGHQRQQARQDRVVAQRRAAGQAGAVAEEHRAAALTAVSAARQARQIGGCRCGRRIGGVGQ